MRERCRVWSAVSSLCFFNDTATTEIYTLSLHDALPICRRGALEHVDRPAVDPHGLDAESGSVKSEERFSRNAETDIVCRLLLGKKKKKKTRQVQTIQRACACSARRSGLQRAARVRPQLRVYWGSCWHLPCRLLCLSFCFFFFNDTATTEIYTLSLHDAL